MMSSRIYQFHRMRRSLVHPFILGFLRQVTTHSNGEASKMLSLTKTCVEHLKNLEENRAGMLRVFVDSGGCSGFQYKFELTTTQEATDHIINQNGAHVIVDEVSLSLLEGATLDYEEELIRSGFRVLKNPQADKGCSCGVSFALKMD